MPISDLLAQITGEPSPTLPPTNILPKRKADDDLRRPVDKVQKTGPPSANSSRNMSQATNPSAVDSSISKMKISSNGQRPGIPNSATSTFKNGQPTPPPSTDAPKLASKPPKKGSYAEIMARGKAAQATLGQIGKIQHKRIEKPPSKRELEQLKAQKSDKLQKALGPNSKFRTGDQPPLKDGRNGRRKNNGKATAAPEPEKKAKKAALATTGYAGTARPKTGGAKGPSRPSTSSSRHERDRYGNDRRGSSGRYGYASEEDEDDEAEEEEGDEYDSDVSSDMEAAAFEVDEEEELAARIARREDAEALAEENRLKREKEEKKRRLIAMAAKAKARR